MNFGLRSTYLAERASVSHPLGRSGQYIAGMLALRRRDVQRPHPGRSGQAVRRDPRTYPPDRSQGHEQAAPAFAFGQAEDVPDGEVRSMKRRLRPPFFFLPWCA